MEYKIEELNKFIKEGHSQTLVDVAEFASNVQFESLIRLMMARIGESDNFCIGLMVTGPSASGKTTFSKKLTDTLAKQGITTHYVSLDDYYNDIRITQKKQLEEGFVPDEHHDFDYERIDAFNVPFFRKQMREFVNNKEISVPKFDFTIGRPNGIRKVIKRTGKDLIIVEGIQAMNKDLTKSINFDLILKVYICPFDSFSYDGNTILDSKQIRFMRRCVRDYYTRNATVARTMEMWTNVRIAEERDIKPQKKNSYFMFNSAVLYEANYLVPKFLELCKELDDMGQKRLNEIVNINSLKVFEKLEPVRIPNGAIFTEFYF